MSFLDGFLIPPLANGPDDPLRAVPPPYPAEPPVGPVPGVTAPAPRQNPTTEAIETMGTSTVAQPGPSNVHVLTIIGQVEGHLALPAQNKTTKYEHVIPQLVAVEQNPQIEGLMVILNTVGGDVEAGLAIAEMIASMSKPSVSIVLGGGHSIGVPIAVSTTHSYIASTATMTIHPIRLTGLVIGVPQTTKMHILRMACRRSFASGWNRSWRRSSGRCAPKRAGPGCRRSRPRLGARSETWCTNCD